MDPHTPSDNSQQTTTMAPSSTSSTSSPPLRVLIAGTGIAGLTCAHKFLTDSRWSSTRLQITVVERKDRCGGRVKTMRESTSSSSSSSPSTSSSSCPSWYEAGASRIAHRHHRVRHLAHQLGCSEVPLPDTYDHHRAVRALHQRFDKARQTFLAPYTTDVDKARALQTVTWKDLLTMVCPTRQERDALVHRWGFLSVLQEMNAYDFWTHAMPQYTDTAYYTLQNGLQSLPDALLERLRKDARVTVRMSTRLVHVERGARGTLRVVLEKDGHASVLPLVKPLSKTATTHKETYDIVFLALPAEALDEVDGEPARYTHLWNAVSRNRLIRCYARYADGVGIEKGGVELEGGGRGRRSSSSSSDTPRTHKRTRRRTTPASSQRKSVKRASPTHSTRLLSDLSSPAIRQSPLHKCTTTNAPHWVQLAYCDHQYADHLSNTLRLSNGQEVFRNTVQRVLGPAWATYDTTDIHFWKHGTHSWKPQLLADDHYHRCLHPDAKLPLFVVGSSLSHYGHWMEGALETVDDAYKRCRRWVVEWLGIGPTRRRRTASTTTSAPPPAAAVSLHHTCDNHANTYTMDDVRRHQWVVLDGYVYDVKSIVDQHPGGRMLLKNVLGTDISETYHRVGHSGVARGWVEGFCLGRVG